MTGSATAAQRLLALDPGDVAALTFELSAMCDQIADLACKELADLSDPLLDVLAQRHSRTRTSPFRLLKGRIAAPCHRISSTASRIATTPVRSGNGTAGEPLRIGVGGPVGSGKTALVAALCRELRDELSLAVLTNDIYTTEDADFLRSRGWRGCRTRPAPLPPQAANAKTAAMSRPAPTTDAIRG